MALKLDGRYPGRFSAASADYPQGSFKNRTTPTAKDGSYLEKDWANDKEGFFQSLIASAGIVPSGAVDKVGASQYFDALGKVIGNVATGRLINVQVFLANGTYTPTAGMKSVEFEVRGAGGGAGGAQSTSATQFGIAGGAGGGALAIGRFLAAAIGASQPVTVGIGGAGGAGAAGGSSGSNGGTSSVGTLISAAGGVGGLAATTTTLTSNIGPGAQGGTTIVGGNIKAEPGQAGQTGTYIGSSFRGGVGGGPAANVGGVIGDTTSPDGGLGSGASGHATAASTATARTGGKGGNGYVIAREYA
ncbi:hypothetical protein ACF8R6_05970 [Pseudomonas sp. CJQ_7]|uniref:glycine-rich domain-containing protein n=1 Tax=Pseudomonas sp. CJQ_7 TaxID=3367166 RepID=UPI00370A0D7E